MLEGWCFIIILTDRLRFLSTRDIWNKHIIIFQNGLCPLKKIKKKILRREDFLLTVALDYQLMKSLRTVMYVCSDSMHHLWWGWLGCCFCNVEFNREMLLTVQWVVEVK